jgi:hypothetical protein
MNYQLAICTALVSFLVVAPWIYTLTKENKRLRDKYRICSEERTKLAGENMEVRDAFKAIRHEFDALCRSITRIANEYPSYASSQSERTPMGPNDNLLIIRERLQEHTDDLLKAREAVDADVKQKLYQYEHLAVAGAKSLNSANADKANAWELMQWIVKEAARLRIACIDGHNELGIKEHRYDKLLANHLETESVNDVLRKQSECYRISRDQARDDIEGIKRNAVRSVGAIKFEDGSWNDVGQALFSDIGKDLSAGARITSPKRRPRKAASGS